MVKLHRGRWDLIGGARASSMLIGIYGGILRFARQEVLQEEDNQSMIRKMESCFFCKRSCSNKEMR
jgi:hypothetical protein